MPRPTSPGDRATKLTARSHTLVFYTMKNRNLLKKVIFVAVLLLIVFSLLAPAIFSQAPRQEKLLNGLKVLMLSDARADKVSVRLRVHSGAAFDPQGKEGVMLLLAQSTFPNEASREFFIEDLGGGLQIATEYDFIEIAASSNPEGLLTMLETLSTAVSNPPIDKETTAAVKAVVLEQLAEQEKDPSYVADQAVIKRLFGTFPYGRPIMGTPASLEKIGFADLIEARQKFMTADNATIVVTGNFDRALTYRAIRRYFGGWSKSDRLIPPTFRQPDPPVADVLTLISPDPESARVRIALRGVARNDEDFAASMVFTEVLRQRLSSRLGPDDADDVDVRNDAFALPGVIIIGYTLGPPHEKANQTATISKALSDVVTEAEFTSAKAAVKTAWSAKDRISFWLDADTYNFASLDADSKAADAVTFADVKAYAEKVKTQPIATVLLDTPPPTS